MAQLFTAAGIGLGARPMGWFDIRDYGALSSPSDIGPSIAAAFVDLVSYGGGTVFIPPRQDGLNGNRWGWTTLVDGSGGQPSDLLDKMSARLFGVQAQTFIQVEVGQQPLCEIGHSNAIVAVDGLTFAGVDAPGFNAPYILRIRQSRRGIVRNCAFYSLACNQDSFGLVRIVADSTHVEDNILMGCGGFGTDGITGSLCIEGARDTCVVKNNRFMTMDGGGFNGNVQNKGGGVAHIWFGDQGASPTIGPAGTLTVENCQFDATATYLVIANNGANDTGIDRVHLVDCSFAAQSNNAPAVFMRGQQLVIENSKWGNFAAGQICVGFRGGRLIMRDCKYATNCGNTIKFYGATDYAELWDCDPGFNFDTSLFTPTKRVTFIDGVITVI